MMKSKFVVALAAGLLTLAIPLAVPANQPPLSSEDVLPEAPVAAGGDLAFLLFDPWEEVEFAVDLPEGYVDFDMSADPFADWSPEPSAE